MSKIISVYHRRDVELRRIEAKLTRILREITPEALRPGAQYGVRQHANHVQATLNWPGHFPRRGLSLCQGKLYGAADWWRPGSGSPDGSYAMIRESETIFEAVADPAGSRTLWYHLDDEMLVVSNSQRAVTMYTGRFDFEPAVVPWLLATGSLGPDHSYNRHLRRLAPGATLALDKRTWKSQLSEPEIYFEPSAKSRDGHAAALEDALGDTFAAFGDVDARTSAIALSGGCDSRAIASLLLRASPALPWHAVTFGPSKGPVRPGTDVQIAAQVAGRLGIAHDVIERSASPDPTETVITRFVLASEGRIDHLRSLDDMASDRAIYASGRSVLLVGNEGFGHSVPGPTPLATRASVELLHCSEIAEIAPHAAALGLADQPLPDRLAIREDESLLTWRDRLYQQFRFPSVQAPLIETALIDVVNPLLSGRALEVVRALPDAMRVDKVLFREFTRRIGPDLPFVSDKGQLGTVAIMRRPGARRLVAASLASDTAERCFGPQMIRWMQQETERAHAMPVRARGALRAHLDRRLGLRRPRPAAAPVSVHPLRLAFRIHMAVTMVEQLQADAAMERKSTLAIAV